MNTHLLEDSPSYQPGLPIVGFRAARVILERTDLDWFHRIRVAGYITPGFSFEVNWNFVAEFLKQNADALSDAVILEPGCADGLWTCWFTKLGAKHIDASDIENREQFRLIANTFGLPAVYYPGILSTMLPRSIRRAYDVVASLGLLYHVHDPLTTLAMYVRYLRDGGTLFLETGAIEAEEPYLHYTGRSEIYGKEGGNQFIPTTGFLSGALDELGMTIRDQGFRHDPMADHLGRAVGRVILRAEKTHAVGMHHYGSLLEQLGMIGSEFPKQKWYDGLI